MQAVERQLADSKRGAAAVHSREQEANQILDQMSSTHLLWKHAWQELPRMTATHLDSRRGYHTVPATDRFRLELPRQCLTGFTWQQVTEPTSVLLCVSRPS